MSNMKKPAEVRKVLRRFLEEDGLEEDSVSEQKRAEEAQEQIEALEAEVQDLKDKLSRQMADMANMRRRQAEDTQRTRENSVMQFASEMLPILDSFRMSLQSEGSKEDLQQGVEMILGMMTDLLARHGVEEVPAEGEVFDPMVHEAVGVIEQEGAVPGTVLNVQMPGYRIGERVLRPSRVIVAQSSESKSSENDDSVDESAEEATEETESA